MWWPSPMDQACLEVKEEKKGRRTPSPKRHSAWGLEELLATAAPVRQTEDRNAAAAVGSDDDVHHTKVPTLTTTTTTTQRADVIMVDADITSHVDRSTVTAIRSDGDEDEEGSCQSKESSSSYFFDLLNIHSAI